MGLLRSEPMKHGTLVVPVDRAREFIDLIGAEVCDVGRTHVIYVGLQKMHVFCFKIFKVFISHSRTSCGSFETLVSGKNTKMQFEDMNARDMHRPYKKLLA